MTDTQNKFFSRDRAKAFDEIKEMIYARMVEREEDISNDIYTDWDSGYVAATENEIRFIRSVIDMMERS